MAAPPSPIIEGENTMWKRVFLLLLLVTLFVGCNQEKNDDSATTETTKPLPPEVEHGPDQALDQYQKNQQNPWGRP